MSERGSARIFRHSVPAIALIVNLCVSVPLSAGHSELENERLATLIRQLDMLERVAQQSAEVSQTDAHTRYHFDYARLRADIARIRTGIKDYLMPQRAQPRDPDALNGLYRQGKGAPQ